MLFLPEAPRDSTNALGAFYILLMKERVCGPLRKWWQCCEMLLCDCGKFKGAPGAAWSASEHSKMIQEGLGVSQAPRRIPEGGCQAREEISFS
jgi:hypothetical protein